MEPVTPGPVVVVVDCPTAAYLPSLTASPALARCMGARRGGDPGGQTTASGEGGAAAQSGAACVIHLAPAQVGYCFTCNSTLSKGVSKCIREDSTQVLGKELCGSHLPVCKWHERKAIRLCSDVLHAGISASMLLLLPLIPIQMRRWWRCQGTVRGWRALATPQRTSSRRRAAAAVTRS